jgi:hypothetical protein
MVNITVIATSPISNGYLAAVGSRWGTSTVNWTGPGVHANFAFVPVRCCLSGPKPFFGVIIEGTTSVDVIVDLLGWVLPSPTT